MYFSDVSQNAENGNFRLHKIQSRIIYLSNIFFPFPSCQDKDIFMSKRKFRCDQLMFCTQALKICNFVMNFNLVLEFFFQIVRQKASLFRHVSLKGVL